VYGGDFHARIVRRKPVAILASRQAFLPFRGGWRVARLWNFDKLADVASLRMLYQC
jgi:hypothetical protein